MFDKVMYALFACCVVAMLALFVVAVPMMIERGNRADEVADRMGCINLGHARDMGSVYFLDCHGDIKLVRVK